MSRPRTAFAGSQPAQPSGLRASRWPLAFVAVALLALVVVPLAIDRWEAGIEGDITDVLEPAHELSFSLAIVHARQIARFQSYLLSGDPTSLSRYRQARASERGLYDGLLGLSDRMELDVRNKLADLQRVSTDWHVLHADALLSDSARVAYLVDLAAEQVRNEELLRASNDLTEAIVDRAQAGRDRMDRARSLELLFTIGLVLVALLATALVAGIGGRLRALVEEANTQRESADHARREVDAILEATGDGVLGLDLMGRCTSLNPAGARLLGYDPDELVGLDLHDAIHSGPGADHTGADCPLLAAIRAGSTDREPEGVLWRKDGTAIPVQWTVGPLMDGQRVRGAVLTFTDMREIQAAQEALRQAIRARDEVVAVVSHDLRNPMGTIAAAAGMLLDIELPPEKERENLEVIVRATERMNRLIRDLLDVARIEGGGLFVEPETVAVGPLVDEAVDLLKPLVHERGLELSKDVEAGLPAVHADRDRVLQVLSNLVGNALKFTEHGEIRIAARSGDGGGVVFSVSDQGGGIPPEALDHIFDRFWQQNRSDRQGAGLGLAIVRGIVESHGGRVWVESRIGEGTTFFFDLPVAAGKSVPVHAAARV